MNECPTILFLLCYQPNTTEMAPSNLPKMEYVRLGNTGMRVS